MYPSRMLKGNKIMGLIDYLNGMYLAYREHNFRALLIAAILRADNSNLQRLESAFPELVQETKKRIQSPGGAISHHEKEYLEDQSRIQGSRTNGNKR